MFDDFVQLLFPSNTRHRRLQDANIRCTSTDFQVLPYKVLLYRFVEVTQKIMNLVIVDLQRTDGDVAVPSGDGCKALRREIAG